MEVAILKYNAGNTKSVENSLKRLGINPIITDNPETLKSADKVIFPGVGEAKNAMEYLVEKKLDIIIKDLKQPVLGICIGLQLLCEFTEEKDTHCIGVFPVRVKKFIKPKKVPHVGWNNLYDIHSELIDSNSELRDQNNDIYMYFVHSYYAELSVYTEAKCLYEEEFSSILRKDNFYAVQFHPEKSGKNGANLLNKFINITK